MNELLPPSPTAPHERSALERHIIGEIVSVSPVAVTHPDENTRAAAWMMIDRYLDALNMHWHEPQQRESERGQFNA